MAERCCEYLFTSLKKICRIDILAKTVRRVSALLMKMAAYSNMYINEGVADAPLIVTAVALSYMLIIRDVAGNANINMSSVETVLTMRRRRKMRPHCSLTA